MVRANFCKATPRWAEPGPNFRTLLTVSTELALTEAGNFVLTASGFQWLAANFGFCAFGKVLCISANTHRCIIWVKPKLIFFFPHANFHLSKSLNLFATAILSWSSATTKMFVVFSSSPRSLRTPWRHRCRHPQGSAAKRCSSSRPIKLLSSQRTILRLMWFIQTVIQRHWRSWICYLER